jgi:hypothetical protein
MRRINIHRLSEMTHRLPGMLVTLTLLATTGAAPVLAEDPCAGFKWDVSKERALFGSPATPLAAAKDGKPAAAVVPNRFYQIQLLPVGEVAFPVPPGKTAPAEGSFGGVLALTIPASGSYRIAVDLPLWIDVAADGKLVAPSDYQGLHGCSAPRKIVQFKLDGPQHMLLQLSAADQAVVRLTVTPVG